MKTIKEINEFLARAEFGEDAILSQSIDIRNLLDITVGWNVFSKKRYTDSFDSQIPLLEKYGLSPNADFLGTTWQANLDFGDETFEAETLPEASARALVAEIELQEKK